MESYEVLGPFGTPSRIYATVGFSELTACTKAGFMVTFSWKTSPRISNTPVYIGEIEAFIFFDDNFDISHSYLNNPEVMSGAAFFGLALVSGSKFVLSLAIIRYLSHWRFLSKVEK
jgi:hypothetical protein